MSVVVAASPTTTALGNPILRFFPICVKHILISMRNMRVERPPVTCLCDTYNLICDERVKSTKEHFFQIYHAVEEYQLNLE